MILQCNEDYARDIVNQVLSELRTSVGFIKYLGVHVPEFDSFMQCVDFKDTLRSIMKEKDAPVHIILTFAPLGQNQKWFNYMFLFWTTKELT